MDRVTASAIADTLHRVMNIEEMKIIIPLFSQGTEFASAFLNRTGFDYQLFEEFLPERVIIYIDLFQMRLYSLNTGRWYAPTPRSREEMIDFLTTAIVNNLPLVESSRFNLTTGGWSADSELYKRNFI